MSLQYQQKEDKNVVQMKFNIMIKLIVGLPSILNEKQPLFVKWKRGSKRQNKGQTRHIAPSDGVVMWGEPLFFDATLLQQPKTSKFEKKNLSFSVKKEVTLLFLNLLSVFFSQMPFLFSTISLSLSLSLTPFIFNLQDKGKKTVSLYKLKVDLSEFAADGLNVTKEYKLLPTSANKDKAAIPTLTVCIH